MRVSFILIANTSPAVTAEKSAEKAAFTPEARESSSKELCYNPAMRRHKTVLTFGTFDGLHAGHIFFLSTARKQGDHLVAVVTQDRVVKELKGRAPRAPLKARLACLRASGLVDRACAGDKVLGAWSAVKKYRPDIIALGYDQDAPGGVLGEFIKKRHLPTALVRLPARQGEKHHSSLLPSRKN